AESAARVIAPAAAIGPRRQHCEHQQHENDQEDQTHRLSPSLQTTWSKNKNTGNSVASANGNIDRNYWNPGKLRVSVFAAAQEQEEGDGDNDLDALTRVKPYVRL